MPYGYTSEVIPCLHPLIDKPLGYSPTMQDLITSSVSRESLFVYVALSSVIFKMKVLNSIFGNANGKKIKRYTKNICSVKKVKRYLPILQWIRSYDRTCFIQDLIAGVTVGLLSIPSIISSAAIAGLPTEYGLYAGITGGFVYSVFGGCKDIVISPTGIMAILIARYNADITVLLAFLSGVIQLLMGILHLGFVVQFISRPVISGFTNAAAVQISLGQMKSFFGYSGAATDNIVQSFISFVNNIKSLNVCDTALGVSTIILIVVLQKLGQGCSPRSNFTKQLRWYISQSRSTIVIVIGMLIAFITKISTSTEPFTVVGEIPSGLPKLKPPPFSTVVDNETLDFSGMIVVLGPRSLILPIVSILEIVAIASSFSDEAVIDFSQEMIALGFCNIVGSFVSGMPVTSSFSRSALNHASGVRTAAGGVFTGTIIILALSLLTSTFYYIPKPTLAGFVLSAMYSLINFKVFPKLWKFSKREFSVTLITMIVCLSTGLEYGMVAGIILEVAMLLYNNSFPTLKTTSLMHGDIGDIITIQLSDSLAYCAVQHVRRQILRVSVSVDIAVVVLDGANLNHVDYTIALNLLSVAKDLKKKNIQLLFLNFSAELKDKCVGIDPECVDRFKTISEIIQPVQV